MGYTILYVGHKGHEEAIGVLAEAPKSMILIDGKEAALKVNPENIDKLAYLTQTTLSLTETQEIIRILESRFPNIQEPRKEDICYATTNRQLAVKELAKQADLVLVLGSQNSSNSQRLREVAENEGATAHLIDNKDYIQDKWLENINSIGITAGASAPEKLVYEVVLYIQERSKNVTIREIDVVKESMFFPIPNLLEQVNKQIIEELVVTTKQ